LKALQIESFGQPSEVLRLVDVDEPGEPGPGEVLVSVQLSPLNAHDVLLIAGHLAPVELPTVAGNEGLAVVLAVGAGVNNVACGDHVALPLLSGAWRERLIISAEGLFALPDADPQQLAMLGGNAPTAGLILSEYVTLQPGDWIIQNAANSGVGRSLTALARHRGLHTISLVRRPELVEELTGLGAGVVLLDTPEVLADIRNRFGNNLIRLGVDAVGGRSADTLVAAVAPGATVVSYANAAKQPGDTAAAAAKQVALEKVYVITFDNATKVVPVIHEAAPLVASGELTIPIEAIYDMADVNAAINHLTRGGKILLAIAR
jgi:NADPH:quinone reductase-like Zn-dependent oxidoreductase